MSQLVLNVSLIKERKGYSVICTDLEVASQGETVEEALANIKDALEGYLEVVEEEGMLDDVLGRRGSKGKHACC